MAKSKSNKHKGKGRRPQQRPQPAKAQSAKTQDNEQLPVSGNRQARRAQEHSARSSGSKKPLALRIFVIVLLAAILLGFFIAPLLSTR